MMVNRLVQSNYFPWSIMKSQLIPNTSFRGFRSILHKQEAEDQVFTPVQNSIIKSQRFVWAVVNSVDTFYFFPNFTQKANIRKLWTIKSNVHILCSHEIHHIESTMQKSYWFLHKTHENFVNYNSEVSDLPAFRVFSQPLKWVYYTSKSIENAAYCFL